MEEGGEEKDRKEGEIGGEVRGRGVKKEGKERGKRKKSSKVE